VTPYNTVGCRQYSILGCKLLDNCTRLGKTYCFALSGSFLVPVDLLMPPRCSLSIMVWIFSILSFYFLRHRVIDCHD
ncbi:unnamed protein product, partial [Ascophyllum nodosum]